MLRPDVEPASDLGQDLVGIPPCPGRVVQPAGDAGGERFPVNLDDVWPMAYRRKKEAERALREMNFVEGEDLGILHSTVENSSRGHHDENII